MLKIESNITATISDNDYRTLSTVCELARRWLDEHKGKQHEFSPEELCDLHQFLSRIFDR